jgi:uncharacterized protein YneF (UPF0154 family)
MDRQKMIVVVTLGFFLVCAQALSGCVLFPAVIVPGVAQYDQSMAQTDLPELAQRHDVIAMASHVGQSMGYDVSLQNDDMVILLYETYELREPITGEYQSIRIFVYKVAGGNNLGLPLSQDKEFRKVFEKIKPPPFKGETVRLAVYGDGAGRGGSQAKINQIMGDFKHKLLALASSPPPGKTP